MMFKDLEKLRNLGLIDEVELRNLKIKNEYKELRKKMKCFEAYEVLSKKYYLSEKTIQNILYDKRKKKKHIRLV